LKKRGNAQGTGPMYRYIKNARKEEKIQGGPRRKGGRSTRKEKREGLKGKYRKRVEGCFGGLKRRKKVLGWGKYRCSHSRRRKRIRTGIRNQVGKEVF